FLDTPGLHAPKTRLGKHMNAVARESIEGADVIVLVTDGPIGDMEKSVIAATTDRPLILALNKVDRVKDKTKLLPMLQELGESSSFAAIVPMSGLKKDGLERLLSEIEERLPEGEHPYPADEL